MYPTREQAQAMVNCVGTWCRECLARNTCGDDPPIRGKAMLAMHDALDAKQAELDKAKDLIRDVVAWANSNSHPEKAVEIYRLIEQAEAMTSGTVTPSCTWTQEDDWENSANWNSGCGEKHCLDDGPTKNRMRYCCYCGKPVEEVWASHGSEG